MVFFGIIVAIIIFSIVVLIHEYGHFKSARIFGVKVEEFGLGIPPRAKKLWTDKNGTLFSLNWLPLGGFVKIAGESPISFAIYNKKGKLLSLEEIEKHLKKEKSLYDKKGEKISKKDEKIILEKITENNAPYNLSKKPAWQQSIVILAGVFMNFLLASVIFSFLFFFGVKPLGINDKIPIQTELKLIPTLEQSIESGIIEKNKGIYLYPVDDSIAQKSGIKKEDLLLRINDENFSDISDVQKIIGENPNSQIVFYIKRTTGCPDENKDVSCPITIEYLEIPLTPGNNGKIGSYLAENFKVNTDFTYKYTALKSIKYGFLETYGHAKLTFKALGMLGQKILFPETKKERSEAVNQLSGPIGIVDFISSSLSNGVIFLIIITAIISVNLGVFNLLPIPALDGGRFLFIVVNSIFSKITGKKRIPQGFENSVHVLFFIILIILSIVIAYNDVVKIINN